jgi:hypothetical protein
MLYHEDFIISKITLGQFWGIQNVIKFLRWLMEIAAIGYLYSGKLKMRCRV